MLDPASRDILKGQIAAQVADDRTLLDRLRVEIRPLKDVIRRVNPRTTTSISLVAADGGNNQLRFDPFLIQLVRVVDSSNNELCLEVLSPTTSVDQLSARQFGPNGEAVTPLGLLMQRLGTPTLPDLSHMIRRDDDGRPKSPSWVQVYRELVEWATLYSIVATQDFATDTLIVFDGLLRSKVFAGDNFARYRSLMEDAIGLHLSKRRRNVYLVGLAKHSKVLDRYRLAMTLEGIMKVAYACYAEIPYEIEKLAYVWQEYARGSEVAEAGGEINKFVAGKMFFVKFGSRPRDPIWPVDIFEPQAVQASTIFGYLLADCINGFPVPLYPRCLQKAHENAALVDFDLDILQDLIFEGVRDSLGAHAPSLDAFRLEDHDPAASRY